VATDANGQNATFWASVQGQRRFCRPAQHDCGQATRIVDGTEIANWVRARIPAVPPGDSEPFFERFSAVNDAAGSVLGATSLNVWRITTNANDNFTYTRLTPDNIAAGTPPGIRGIQGQAIHASPQRYTVGGASARIYGVVLTGGNFATLTDTGSGTPALTATA